MSSPVVIAPYSNDWPLQFTALQFELYRTFQNHQVLVEHIGSTAIPGLSSKPVIDVLLGAGSLLQIESEAAALAKLGYQYVAKYETQLPMRRYFVRAESPGALRVHLHGVVRGSRIWQEQLAFRNALRGDRALASRYERLKLELAARFADDKAAYTEAKGPFIQAVLDTCRESGHTPKGEPD